MARAQLSLDIVIDTAAAIADDEGLDAVSLTRVSNAVGTTQPALYRYVDSFDDLIRALGLLGRQVLAERLAEASADLTGEEAIRAMGYAWRSMVRDHPGLYAATDRFPCAGDAELEAAVDRVVSVLSRALRDYPLSEDQRVHAGRALRSAFHGFSHLESGDGHPHNQQLDDSFDNLLDLLCRGIKAMAAE
ncbi:MAG: WHG domain-containing protein [Acidimicrobiia bacterium]|nr:WHG domain-containing protein [Acidimicrobiia bacterium]